MTSRDETALRLADAEDELRRLRSELTAERARTSIAMRRAEAAEASARRAWQLGTWHRTGERA